jgi:predicted nucleic acid-binding protein
VKLVDVGVWLAAVWGRHIHHPIAADWFAGEADDIVFCRVTQMWLLRLLSNPAIMGDDAVDRSQAWRTYDLLWADDRVLWADEPAELEAVWRASPPVMTRATSCGPMTTWQPLPRLATPR